MTKDEIIIQAKYSPHFLIRHKAPPYLAQDSVALQVIKSFKNTLDKLRVANVDDYFLHRLFESAAQTYAAWGVMQEIKHRGGTRLLGISQVDADTLESVCERAEEKPGVVQNSFSPKDDYDIKVRNFCKTHQTTYQAFGILGLANQEVLSSLAVMDLAQKAGVSPQAALPMLVLHCANEAGEKFGVLGGSAKAVHLEENMRCIQQGDVRDVEGLEDFRARMFFSSTE